MKYVLAMPKALHGLLQDFSKLYAFPTAPELSKGVRILDSGAYALSKQGRTIGSSHMTNLARHYQQHATKDTFCVAPDAFLSPAKTMRNWQIWQINFQVVVCPVIQFSAKFQIKESDAAYQCECYADNCAPAWFISNPSVRGGVARAQGIGRVVNMCRAAGARYIHVLGAGWDIQDVIDWSGIPGINSIDSVAYYTSAQQGKAWDGGEYADWKGRAVANANFAKDILEKYGG